MKQIRANPIVHQKILSDSTDLVGKKIGYLTVLSVAKGKHKRGMYLCLCECGKHIEATKLGLLSRKVTHCGCLKRVPVDPSVRAELEAKYNGKVSPAFQRKRKVGFDYGWKNKPKLKP